MQTRFLVALYAVEQGKGIAQFLLQLGEGSHPGLLRRQKNPFSLYFSFEFEAFKGQLFFL